MYLDTIEAIAIKKSGLTFLRNMCFIPEDFSFSKIESRLKSSLNKIFPVLPDLAIPGDYHSREELFDLSPILKSKPDSILLITGIPTEAPNLDFYKFKDAQYTKYLETEDDKGILFQVVPNNSRLIPISYGAN